MFSNATTLAVFFLALSGASATLSAKSKAGEHLLSRARKLNDNNNYYSWVKDYSIKFDGCSSVPSFEREEGEGMKNTLLAKFKLCPTENSCDECKNSGEYVVEMDDFVNAHQQATMTIAEYNCEATADTCEYQCENGMYDMTDANNYYYYNGDDGDYCKNVCMSAAGMSACIAEDDEEEMDYEGLTECQAIEGGNNNNNNYGQVFYTGAHCVNGGVYLNTFTDATCTTVAPEGTFYQFNGYNLPTDNLVSDECVSCKDIDNDNQNDYYNNGAAMEVCGELYQASGKCEQSLEGSLYPDTSACDLIQNTLPLLDGSAKRSGGAGAKFAAWLFFCTTLGACAVIFTMHKKVKASSDYQGGLFS